MIPHLYVIKIIEKRGHEFEKENGGGSESLDLGKKEKNNATMI